MRKLKHKREIYVYETGTPLVKQYKQIRPLETDTATGEIINLSTEPILKEVDPINIQDHIQSFEEEQDIKNLIKRMEAGDETAKTGRAGDYMEETLPEDYHSLIKEAERLNKEIEKYNKLLNKGDKDNANNTGNESIQQEQRSNNETEK